MPQGSLGEGQCSSVNSEEAQSYHTVGPFCLSFTEVQAIGTNISPKGLYITYLYLPFPPINRNSVYNLYASQLVLDPFLFLRFL